jgi:RimJ/RimL family protein N-acetyltransferase
VASARFTDRLRLEPIGLHHAHALWVLHNDDAVAHWHGGAWSVATAERFAAEAASAWATDGVHKWMAYDRATSELIGRGGLSRARVDGADRLEVGWTVRDSFWGLGYATEIGRAGLAFAFDELDAKEVVAFTGPHNTRSRAVMERLGMRNPRDVVHNDEQFVLYTLTQG